MTTQPQNYGLLAAPPVRWLVSREPEVKRSIEAFIRDEAERDEIDVAGPPSDDEIIKARRNPKHPVYLPRIRLKMRKITHHLTGEPGIEVTCSDDACEEIVRWHNRERLRAAARKPH